MPSDTASIYAQSMRTATQGCIGRWVAIAVTAGVLVPAGMAAPAAAEPGPGGRAGTVSGYRLVDLRLGGDSTAADVNDRGEVAGGTAAPQAFVWSAGRVRLLPGLGGQQSAASAINNRSLVAGTAQTRSGQSHVVVWVGGKVRDLGFQGTVNGINDHGVIVGTAFTAGGTSSAFRWANGRLTTLTALGVRPSPRTTAVDINESGQIVGEDASGPFLLTGRRLERLTRPGARMTMVTAINDRGEISGAGSTATATDLPMIWSRTGVRILPTLGAYAPNGQKPRGIVFGLNASGQAVGESSTPQNPDYVPVLWTARGTAVQLQPGRLGIGIARGINSHGLVIGEVTDALYPQAVVWIRCG